MPQNAEDDKREEGQPAGQPMAPGHTTASVNQAGKIFSETAKSHVTKF